jgi:RimJ/RimL family protein N-acetyltransferase
MPTIRRLLPTEQDLLRVHLQHLTATDRRLRFQGQVSDRVIAERVRTINWFRTHVLVALEDGVVIGAAEVAFERAWRPTEAEVAITVNADRQGEGIGTELTRRAVQLARVFDAQRVVMVCLTENAKMRRIAQGLAAELAFEQGEVVSRLTLQPATVGTWWSSALAGWVGLVASAVERWRASRIEVARYTGTLRP